MARATYNFDGFLIDERTEKVVYRFICDGDGYDAFYTLDNGRIFKGIFALLNWASRNGFVYCEY